MNRRTFAQTAGTLAAAMFTSPGCVSTSSTRGADFQLPHRELESLDIAGIQKGFDSRRFSARELAAAYLQRIQSIDQGGPRLKSVIEINPDAMAIAARLDDERRSGNSRGPLHGVPVLIKDNIDTHDRMRTSAGSLALAKSTPLRDAFLVERLRAAGAVILGKTNLSEWANFRGSKSISGWSARGGQTRNPYCLDRSPSGSSSGSAAAVSAALCAVSVGTETNGSIVSPASFCGVVGFKPTVGLVSRSGVIPISSSQDTAGPMARSVKDAAILLSAMRGTDSRDPSTDRAPAGIFETAFSLAPGSLKGARLGVLRSALPIHPRVDRLFERALQTLRSEGAVLIDPVTAPARPELGDADYQVMLYEFKAGLNAYFASLGGSGGVRTLEQLIAFNEAHREQELPFFGQETLVAAQAKGPLTESRYLEARQQCLRWSREKGIDAIMSEHRLDAIVAPTGGPAHTLDHLTGDRWLGGSSTLAAVAGYPNLTLPCGDVFELPIGLSFFGSAWSEMKILQLAHAFEQAAPARRVPRYLPTLPLGH